MERFGVEPDALGGVAFRVERHEHRLHPPAVGAERFDRVGDRAQVGRTGIGTVQVTEVEQHDAAVPLRRPDARPALVGERERHADRHAPAHQLVHQPGRIGAPRGLVARCHGTGGDERGRREPARRGPHAPNVNSVPLVDGTNCAGISSRSASASPGPEQCIGIMHVRIQHLQLGDGLLQIGLVRRKEVEAADDRVHLAHARDLHRLSRRVDDAAMAARGNHDQAAVLQVEAGRVLAEMLVGDRLALCALVGVGDVAAEAVPGRVLDQRVRQHALERGALDGPGRERLAGDDGRRRAHHHPHLERGELAAVEDAEVRQVARLRPGAEAAAEGVLAADVEREIGGQAIAVLLQERQQAAEVVVMAVAQDVVRDRRRDRCRLAPCC